MFVRGLRFNLAKSRPYSAHVTGCTAVSDPATRMPGALDRSRSGLRDQFAVVGHIAAIVDSPGGLCIGTDHVVFISVHAANSDPKWLGRVVETRMSRFSELSGRRGIDPVPAFESRQEPPRLLTRTGRLCSDVLPDPSSPSRTIASSPPTTGHHQHPIERPTPSNAWRYTAARS